MMVIAVEETDTVQVAEKHHPEREEDRRLPQVKQPCLEIGGMLRAEQMPLEEEADMYQEEALLGQREMEDKLQKLLLLLVLV